jgi:parvulin-like peptidyl-prolyl isomerase
VRVSQIVVRAAPDAPAAARAEARHKIEEIMKEVRAGKDFAELARAYSEGPEAAHGGDSGFVTRGGRALPPIERAAFSLGPGQTSDILETRRGFHIIKVTGKRPAGAVPFEEVKEAIRTKLTAQARAPRIKEYVDGLKAAARVERTSALPPQ